VCVFFFQMNYLLHFEQRRACKNKTSKIICYKTPKYCESRKHNIEWLSIIFYSSIPVLNLKIMNNNFLKIIINRLSFLPLKSNLSNFKVWYTCRELKNPMLMEVQLYIMHYPTFVFAAYL